MRFLTNKKRSWLRGNKRKKQCKTWTPESTWDFVWSIIMTPAEEETSTPSLFFFFSSRRENNKSNNSSLLFRLSTKVSLNLLLSGSAECFPGIIEILVGGKTERERDREMYMQESEEEDEATGERRQKVTQNTWYREGGRKSIIISPELYTCLKSCMSERVMFVIYLLPDVTFSPMTWLILLFSFLPLSFLLHSQLRDFILQVMQERKKMREEMRQLSK